MFNTREETYEERRKTCGRCVHQYEDPDIVDSMCYLCKRNATDHRTDWFEEELEPEIYEGDNVVVRPPWDPRIIEGYEGAFCKCGCVLHIKTPKIKNWHPIKCPECGHVLNLFCGKNGVKIGMDEIRAFVPTVGEFGD